MNRRSRVVSSYLGLGLISIASLACGGSTTPATEPAVPTTTEEAATADAKDTTEEAANTPLADSATSAAPEANAPPKEEAIATTTPFMHMVLEGFDSRMSGQHFDAPYFIEGWGPHRHVIARTSPDGKYARDASFMKGLEHVNISAIYGGLDTGAIVTGTNMRSRVGWSLTLERTAMGWRELHTENPGAHYANVQRWTGERLLAYVMGGFPRGEDTSRYKFKILSGPSAGVVLPKITMQPKKDGENWGPSPVVDPKTFAAFESGHIIVLGHDKYEHFAPGKTRGKIGVLPASTLSPHFAKKGDKELLVVLKRTLGRFDGARWASWPLPNDEQAHDVAYHDGTFWAVTQTHLYKRQGTTWQEVAIAPPPSEGTREIATIASMGNALWLTSKIKLDKKTGLNPRLWSSVRPPRGMQALESSDDKKPFGARAMLAPKKAKPGCANVFAVFFGVAKSIDAKHDFPITRKALRGHREFSNARFVKTEEAGRQYFGAFVKDYAAGRKLAGIVGRKVKGATPKLLCHKPKVIAELDLDLATGKASGWAPYRD